MKSIVWLRNDLRLTVHQPWKMTPDQQKLYEMEIGKDYQEPMIDLENSYEEIKARD